MLVVRRSVTLSYYDISKSSSLERTFKDELTIV